MRASRTAVEPAVPRSSPRLVAADGGRAELSGEGIDFFDPDGRLLVRYENGALEIAPRDGDLRLRAPAGRVQIESGEDIELTARGCLKLRGATMDLRAQQARGTFAKLDLIAAAVRASATTIETQARKIETTAERVRVVAKDVAQEVAGLLDSRAGRVRSIVRGAFSLRTKTVNMKSEEDTAIDGRRVLLG